MPDSKLNLSERETEVVRCLMKGASNKQIARDLDIAEVTVKFHLARILKKLNMSGRTAAAIWAVKQLEPLGNCDGS